MNNRSDSGSISKRAGKGRAITRHKAYNTTSVSEHDMHEGTSGVECGEQIQFLVAPSFFFVFFYI